MERVAKFINGILGKKTFDVYEYEEEEKEKEKKSWAELSKEYEKKFEGAWEETGFKDEEDLVRYIKEVVRPAVYEKTYGKTDGAS